MEIRFKDDLEKLGCSVYYVGGCIRDKIRGKSSKDTDLLVTNILIEDLITILQAYGSANLVGESFGVIKYKDSLTNEEFDIAVPRKERKVSEGHRGFEVETGTHITLEDDLSRRDFTMNAIAVNVSTGRIHDPFGGYKAIQASVIEQIHENSFFDDPLRMLRAIQFAVRFNFSIEENTKMHIVANAHLIKQISQERILEEFEKMLGKENTMYGVRLLVETDLYNKLFDGWCMNPLYLYDIHKAKTVAEFIWFMCGKNLDRIETFFAHNPSNWNRYRNEVQTLCELHKIPLFNDGLGPVESSLWKIFLCQVRCPSVLNSRVFGSLMTGILVRFKEGYYITSIKDLAVNGHDLIDFGLRGQKISKAQTKLVKYVLSFPDRNNKEMLLEYLQSVNFVE